MSRYYIQYAGKEAFEDRYVVVDARTNQEASLEKLPYDQAKARMKSLEQTTADHLEPISPWLGGWRG